MSIPSFFPYRVQKIWSYIYYLFTSNSQTANIDKFENKPNIIIKHFKTSNCFLFKGMHEILACIMYVLYEEYSKLSDLNETK